MLYNHNEVLKVRVDSMIDLHTRVKISLPTSNDDDIHLNASG